MSTTTNPDPFGFFYEHAGYSWDPKTETQDGGRARCARQLAMAERWASAAGVRFEWQQSPEPVDRSGIDHASPLWDCIARHDDETAALCEIDLGDGGDPWTRGPGAHFARLFEAELASELMPE